jgi:acetylornithine deacetylase/succinyl-diaminopimelate desuccinylase-like protein
VSIRVHLWLLLIAACWTASLGQSPVRDYRRAHERQILDEFTRLLAIPNIASDKDNIRRNAQFILEMMQRRGLNPQLLEAKSRDTPPAVYGEWKVAGATHSIILYAHYDGQPVDPKQWTASPPFQPTWRTAAMEKGGQVVTLTKPVSSESSPRSMR